MDIVSPEVRSRIMSRIRSNSKLDERLHNFLKSRKIKHRMHPAIDGSPDALVFPDILVFVDGCFWHNCPQCGTTPSTRRDYWKPKLARTKARDQRNTKRLRRMGWRVVREWEHRFLSSPDHLMQKVRRLVDTTSQELLQ